MRKKFRTFVTQKPQIINGTEKAEAFESLELRHVSFTYPFPEKNPKQVLSDVSFTARKGEKIAVVGYNGAGKTTLFNCLNRDLKADGGNFWIEEANGARRAVVAEDIGYVLSTPTVPEFLTGREFLKFFMDINEKSLKNPRSIDEYFDSMSIAPEDRDKLLKDYSHGMKNKMQMLINIIAQPNVLLLDEPLTSLDVVVAEEMKQLLRSLKQGRVTIFFHAHHGLGARPVRRNRAAQPRRTGSRGKKQTWTAGNSRRRFLRPCGRKKMRKTLRICVCPKKYVRVMASNFP